MNIGHSNPNSPTRFVFWYYPKFLEGTLGSSFSPAYLLCSLLRLFKASSPGPWEQLTKIRSHSPERTSGGHRKGTWSQRPRETGAQSAPSGEYGWRDSKPGESSTSENQMGKSCWTVIQPGHLDLKEVLVTDNVNTTACWPVVVVLS